MDVLPRTAWSKLLFVTLISGCAGPGPELFPPGPLTTERLSDGAIERGYDTNDDGQVDYRERLARHGRVTRLHFSDRDHGTLKLAAVQGDGASSGTVSPDDTIRHLIIMVDSVPYALVHELWQQGRFRLFHSPSRVISPFPVMTDLAFGELFGISPNPAVESQYYDGTRLTNGYLTYARAGVSPWLKFVDYHMRFTAHSVAYMEPDRWYEHELRRIQQRFYRRQTGNFVGYVVDTSGLGAHYGRNGHQAALIRLDRLCQSIMHRMRGRVHITLLSDHGHDLQKSRRIPLTKILARSGYRISKRLRRPEDVVVPEFSVVTCAAIYTRQPAAVARDVAGIDGIDLTMYRNASDEVVVSSRNGRARISHAPPGYRYIAEYGDPLKLRPTLERLSRLGLADAEGTATDRVFFEATATHEYPDAVHRIWRAFHGLIEHTPDVLVSVRNGWHCGSPFMSNVVDISSAHGSLRRMSSTGFVMSTAAQLPPVQRMENLRAVLHEHGVPLAGR